VATRLGLRYLDTGAMYRALTRGVLDAGIAPTDVDGVTAISAQAQLRPSTDPAHPTITIDGRDVTSAVRTAEVTAAVSAVSAVPAVRQRMVAAQRDVIAGADGIVVEGRDIGSTVAPDAAVKVFLTADTDSRATRRSLELRSRGDHGVQPSPSVAETESNLLRRDELDSSRAASPLRRAPDAVLIDTTAMSVDEVVAAVIDLVEQARRDGRILMDEP
jgi:cytidylate kinase